MKVARTVQTYRNLVRGQVRNGEQKPVVEAKNQAKVELDKVANAQGVVNEAKEALQTRLDNAKTVGEVKTVRTDIDKFVALAKAAADAGKTLEQMLNPKA